MYRFETFWEKVGGEDKDKDGTEGIHVYGEVHTYNTRWREEE
jgi:hypothetical protein